MNIITCGRREEGKTTLAMFLARKYHKGIVVFDPRGMIGGIIVYNVDDLECAIEEGEWNNGPIVFRYDEGDPEEKFEELCEVLFPPRFSLGGFSLVVDEAGFLQNPQYINKAFSRAIKQHPTEATGPIHESVAIIQTNHRLADFNNTCKALMNELFIFQTTLTGDLKTLDEHTGGSREISSIVQNLEQHHCVRYLYGRQPKGMKQYEVWNDPSAWFYDFKRGVSMDNIPKIKKESDWYAN